MPPLVCVFVPAAVTTAEPPSDALTLAGPTAAARGRGRRLGVGVSAGRKAGDRAQARGGGEQAPADQPDRDRDLRPVGDSRSVLSAQRRPRRPRRFRQGWQDEAGRRAAPGRRRARAWPAPPRPPALASAPARTASQGPSPAWAEATSASTARSPALTQAQRSGSSQGSGPAARSSRVRNRSSNAASAGSSPASPKASRKPRTSTGEAGSPSRRRCRSAPRGRAARPSRAGRRRGPRGPGRWRGWWRIARRGSSSVTRSDLVAGTRSRYHRTQTGPDK